MNSHTAAPLLGELDDRICPLAFSDADLQALAFEAGVMGATTFPPELQRFAELVAERCACIGDRYTVQDMNAGEEIRAAFGLG